MRRNSLKKLSLGSLLAILTIGTAAAQSSGLSTRGGQGLSTYRVPGAGVEEPPDRERDLEAALENALWRFGRVRLDPWVGLRDVVGVISSVTPSDISQDRELGATAGVGLRAFLPVASNVVLSAEAFPEYRWARDSSRSRLNTNLGGHFDAFLSRASIHVGASRMEQLQRISPETSALTSQREDLLETLVEIDLRSAVSLFVEVATIERAALESDVAGFAYTSQADRSEDAVSYGVRLRPRTYLSFDVGLEDLDVDFAERAIDRSAKGTSPFVAATLQRGRTLFKARILARKLEAAGRGSLFVPYDDLAGYFETRRELSWRTSIDLQAQRDVFFAFDTTKSHLESNRIRLGLGYKISDPLDLRLFVGTGDDRYFTIGTGLVERVDDVDEWGLRFNLRIGTPVALVVGYTVEDFSSPVPRFDRQFERIHFGLSVSVLGGRLTIQ